MTNWYQTSFRALSRVLALCAITCASFAHAHAQTAADTVIQNRATATYSDGSGNNFATDSNTVSVTVAKVSGITITPDGSALPAVVAGQSARFTFRVTNTGNFSDQVRFLANGASYQVTGPATATSAFIDVNGNGGAFEAGTDIDIRNNAADALSPALAQNAGFDVHVNVTINSNAATNDTVTVRLGDATGDNITATNSANEVRTVSTASVNGQREAVGDARVTIENNAQLLLTLTAPSGPVALGSQITYSWQVCNPGARNADPITLGGTAGVFVVAPIPVGTALASGQTFPAGTLYTTSPLSSAPLDPSTTWSATAPANLAAVTRVAFNVGNGAPLASGNACGASVPMIVNITTSNATTPIFEIGDAFALNSLGATITDQSGDAVRNSGDGNANFDEDDLPGNQAPRFDGVQQRTLLLTVGAVLLGPSGQPAATGPNDQNDDFTNRSVTTGIAGRAPGETTNAAGTVIFTNTIRNNGNANDTFAITAPIVPANFEVYVSTDGGANYTQIVPGGGSVNLAIAFGASADVLVKVVAPSGLLVLQPYATTLRVTSTASPSAYNETINRLYTGFLRLDKTVSVVENTTGNGGANDYVPGAVIEYVVTYTNVSTAGGAGNATLTASNIVITENGNAAPNNWGATTDQIVGSASDTRGGAITGDAVGSSSLTDTIPSLAPGQSGTFRFRRRIK